MNHNLLKTTFSVFLLLALSLAFSVADSIALSDNLVKNPSGTDGNNHWTVNAPWVNQGGQWFGGQGEGGASLEQKIDVSTYGQDIDTGTVRVDYSFEYEVAFLDGIYVAIHFVGDGFNIPLLAGIFTKDQVGFQSWNDYSISLDVPQKTRSITIQIAGIKSGGNFINAWVRNFSVNLTAPKFELTAPVSGRVDAFSLNFGQLYFNTNETTQAYNDGKNQTIAFKNGGDPGRNLNWSIASPSAGISFSSDGGNVSRNQRESIAVKVNPPKGGKPAYSGEFQIKTNDGGRPTTKVSVTATAYGTPTVQYPATNTTGKVPGSNNKVNVARDESFTLEVSSPKPLFPGATLKGYQWQAVREQNKPDPDGWEPAVGSGPARRNFQFSDAIEFTVYTRMVDSNDVGTEPVAIPVRVWERPLIAAAPPSGSAVIGKSWFTNGYVGIAHQQIQLQAAVSDLKGNESIDKFIWLDQTDTVLVEQKPGQVANHTFNQQNLNGTVKVKAVTNHGIESEPRGFELEIYPALEVNPGGPYVGRPKKEVILNGFINKEGYPSAAFLYQWRVKAAPADKTLTDLPASPNPVIGYTWGVGGTFEVEWSVTVTTQEGLKITASEQTTARIEAGVPIARPGGPYRGGITGGNFSPIQLQGNPPDFIQDPDVGKIVNWQWTNGPTVNGLTFDGQDDFVDAESIDIANQAFTIVAWVKRTRDGVDEFIITQGPGFSPNKGLQFGFRSNNVFTFSFWNNDTNTVATYTDREWHHWAGTYDPQTKDRIIYRDGQLVFRQGTFASYQGTGPLTLGGTFPSAIGVPFQGSFDDVAVFNRALTQNEITEIMKNSPTGNEDGLLSYWGFDEGQGSTSADLSGKGHDAKLHGFPTWFGTTGETNIWNPTREYQVAGEYNVELRVQSEFGKWSPLQETIITVIDGKIEGTVKAADLRTPVKEVEIKLTSSHVGADALAHVAKGNSHIHTTDDGGLTTTTDDNGKYNFQHLPLGSYRLEASKGSGDDAHEFETKIIATELTLDAPNQLAVDFVDLSVFPIGGQVYYSIRKHGQKVLVEDVLVIAQPVSSTSGIESLPSTKSVDAKNQNYSMPLFAGKYLFKAKRPAHDVRLIGTPPSIGEKQGEPPRGYDNGSQLLTIEDARTDIDFIDYTTRKVKVFVEDSGGFPILEHTLLDGTKVKIKAQATGDNGFSAGEIQTDSAGTTFFTATLPPGKYTVSLPNVPTALVKGEPGKKQAEVDVTAGDQEVTMIVPVQIVLEISPAPKLFNLPQDVLDKLGIKPSDNPEGFMYAFDPKPQEHTYIIKATANGKPVEAFRLNVVDGIRSDPNSPAPLLTYPDPSLPEYEPGTQDGVFVGKYTTVAGPPKMTVVDEGNAATYIEVSDPKTNKKVKAPKALPKEITFEASKAGYLDSVIVVRQVTVLGDVTAGAASKLVSIPNVNYMVLHDPPGDASYSYFADNLTAKGIVGGMKIKLDDREIPVYPSPWSVEREIDGVDFDEIKGSGHDLHGRGLLNNRDAISAGGTFGIAAVVELGIGSTVVLANVAAFALQVAKLPTLIGLLETQSVVQYEVSPSRSLETPVEDEISKAIPDVMGPGKGDIYFGEGWTVGLQTKYRLGIKLQGGQWVPNTQLIETFDILDRTNQYIYTVHDIENIINDLDKQIKALEAGGESEKGTIEERKNAKATWETLLRANPAYEWQKAYVQGKELFSDKDSGKKADRESLDKFIEDQKNGGKLKGEGELLIFTGGSTFEYSRTIAESGLAEYSTAIDIGTSAEANFEGSTGSLGVGSLGPIAKLEFSFGFGAAASIATGHSFGTSLESGLETEQTVGFVLSDSDVGDSFTAHTYEGPWGTPIFFTDPGSVTSDPWEKGTTKAVDVALELISPENNGPFDYREGAHYQFKITSIGTRKLEGSGIDFLFYDLPLSNSRSATVRFNGSDESPYAMELFKGFVATDITSQPVDPIRDGITLPSATVIVSVYPPQRDWHNSAEQEYPVLVQAESDADYQISVNKLLRPRFADLRAPRAIVTAPYDGQRISHAVFTEKKKFKIAAFSDNQDVAKIQLERRNKKPDGVWTPWQIMSGLTWEAGGTNANVTVVEHSDRDPVRRVFTFEWSGAEIASIGEGEYQLRAIAIDKATKLSTDGKTQEPKPNIDLDAPLVTFLVDGSKPTVLITVPFYQDRESKRIYRAELSAAFTDDMNPDDFNDKTFTVTDLLDGAKKVSGFVSYSPALRKAIFVPVTPFQPNGFYRAVIKTDTFNDDGTLKEQGIHDLAGNPLDNEFSWTFRTTDAPFEETWSITLSATDGNSTNANNIAAVAFGAEDEEDEKDARAVPTLSTELDLSFVSKQQVDFDRDTRPADGRLGHHWFIAIRNPKAGSTVQILWKPSIKLTRTTRQYQVLKLVEFKADKTVANTIPLDPTKATSGEVKIHEYTPPSGETIRWFRLDVMKANFVATTFTKGSSGWKFFSAPVTPQRADPFVNLGDDIDPFQMFKYDTKQNGYQIYPLDIGSVSLQSGHGYFTRLAKDAEVDVGGSSNTADQTLTLETAGWHAIGNPFVKPVNVADLKFNNKAFGQAVTDSLIEGTLYRWKVDATGKDSYEAIDSTKQLELWEGYWLKTKSANITLTTPKPAGVDNFIAPLPGSFNPPAAPPVAKGESGKGTGERGFALRFALTSDVAADLTTTLGTRPNASAELDTFDASEPPQLKHTVAAYFDHTNWREGEGLYNADYQPPMEVEETRTWKLVVYTDTPKAKMQLSWARAIGDVPDDVWLTFRQLDTTEEWQVERSEIPRSGDMRQVSTVSLDTQQYLTKVTYEIRAERIALEPISDLSVVAGEAEVKLQWQALDNPFITDFQVYRNGALHYEVNRNEHTFTDTSVVEEASYTYQISVRFKTGAELKSELFTVTVLPVIKATVLLQSYPNPFNPETWIPYELAEDADVTIQFYNVNGQLVRTLNLGHQTRGRYTRREKAAYWDGRTEYGEKAASGVYFYLMTAGNYRSTRKMVIVK